jgi:hypothetical protein
LQSILDLSDTDWSLYTDNFNQALSEFVEQFKSNEEEFFNYIRTEWETLFTDLTTKLQNVLTNMNNALNQWKTAFMQSFNSFSSTHQASWRSWLNALCADFQTAFNNILSSLQNAMNLAVQAINQLISAANSVSGLSGKRYTRVGSISVGSISVPRLAQGAVIPANREFLAVLGDQKQGTNVEAPLATIEQAVQNVLSRMGLSGGNGDQTIIMECDGIQFAKLVYKLNNNESGRVGVSMTEA